MIASPTTSGMAHMRGLRALAGMKRTKPKAMKAVYTEMPAPTIAFTCSSW